VAPDPWEIVRPRPSPRATRSSRDVIVPGERFNQECVRKIRVRKTRPRIDGHRRNRRSRHPPCSSFPTHGAQRRWKLAEHHGKESGKCAIEPSIFLSRRRGSLDPQVARCWQSVWHGPRSRSKDVGLRSEQPAISERRTTPPTRRYVG